MQVFTDISFRLSQFLELSCYLTSSLQPLGSSFTPYSLLIPCPAIRLSIQPTRPYTRTVVKELANTVIALTDVHIATDKTNETRREEKLEDKLIGSMFTESKLAKVGNMVQKPAG